MNADQIKKLTLPNGAKERPRLPVTVIFVGVVMIAATALYFAQPFLKEERRMLVSEKKTNAGIATAAAGLSTNGTRQVLPIEGSVLTVSGYIVNHERTEISPRFMGQVKWIGVKKGDLVTNGQVVVLLDDAEQRARLQETEGRLASAKVAIEKARLDYDRVLKLRQTQVESQQMEDETRLRLEAAQAALKEVEGQVALMKTYLDWSIIRSPIDGVVLEKLVTPGELVMPQSFGGARGPSTALLALADPKDLQVEVELNESDLAKVFLDQKCRITPEAFPDKSYDGYVAEMAPEANRQKGTLQIKVQILSPDKHLTPELSAKVDFLSESRKQK
jgi:HlyD family secretion protein